MSEALAWPISLEPLLNEVARQILGPHVLHGKAELFIVKHINFKFAQQRQTNSKKALVNESATTPFQRQ